MLTLEKAAKIKAGMDLLFLYSGQQQCLATSHQANPPSVLCEQALQNPHFQSPGCTTGAFFPPIKWGIKFLIFSF